MTYRLYLGLAFAVFGILTAYAIGVGHGLTDAYHFGTTPSTPGPTFVIHTAQWDCTTILLDGKWAWPPVCQPVKP